MWVKGQSWYSNDWGTHFFNNALWFVNSRYELVEKVKNEFVLEKLLDSHDLWKWQDYLTGLLVELLMA